MNSFWVKDKIKTLWCLHLRDTVFIFLDPEVGLF